MDEKDKHINPYTASDIRRYLGGEMSAGEMHALEKAAMDDPFLADAIAGMLENEHERNISFESGVTSLNQRLSDKIEADKNKKLIPLFFRWQTAAVVLLLLGSCYLGYVLLVKNPGKPVDISRVVQPGAKTDSIVRGADTAVPAAATAGPVAKNKFQPRASPGRAERQLAKAKAPEGENSKEANAEASPAAAPVAITTLPAEKDEERQAPPLPAPKTTDKAKSAGNTALQGKVAGVQITQSRRKARTGPVPVVLQGLVTDTNGHPIADATVRLENGKERTVTDDSGHFKLKVKAPVSNQTVAVSSPGYSPVTKALPVGGNGDNLIQLREAIDSMKEVVVSGFSSAKRKVTLGYATVTVTDTSTMHLAEPVDGWTELRSYIDNNKQIAPADSSVHGPETISFLVYKNGRLSHFKVEKSLSPAHDEELIRLIKTGPAWKISEGKKQMARVTVNF